VNPRWLLAIAAAALPLCAQTVDFKMLDKLAEKAKESSVVNLGPEQLGMLAGLSAGEGKDLAALAKSLRAIQVRSYEFDRQGEYDLGILRAFRDKLKASGEWVNVIETKAKDGFTDISYARGADGKSKGFLIIAAEPREVSVVYIDGPLDLSSIGKIGGVMGIPAIVGSQPNKSGPAGSKAGPPKQEDEL